MEVRRKRLVKSTVDSSRQGAAYQEPYPACFLYSVGDMPICLRKLLLKVNGSEYPSCKEMSRMEESPVES